MGVRIVEQLRLEWLDYYKGIKPSNPIKVYAQPDVMEDLNGIRNKFGSFLAYYEYMKLIERSRIERTLSIGDISITFVSVLTDQAVSVFVFEAENKKLIYAPCDCLPFPDDDIFYNADVLVLGNTFIGNKLKDGNVITDDHPLRK